MYDLLSGHWVEAMVISVMDKNVQLIVMISFLTIFKFVNLEKRLCLPVFFGRRLEKTIAPRHAYLVHYGVHPHGRKLLETGRFEEFLDACDDSSARFAHLCNQWSSKNVGPFSAQHAAYCRDCRGF